MRRVVVLLTLIVSTVAVTALPAVGGPTRLTPVPSGEGIWLAGPDAATSVDGSSGTASVGVNGTTITVNATGLVPGHAVTMWVIYFNDANDCSFPDAGLSRCGFFDVLFGRGGAVVGASHVIGGSGTATFGARLNVGDSPDILSDLPTYNPSATPDFLAIVRSHGPMTPGELETQLHSVFDGCTTEVGPPPGQTGGEIPDQTGECSDVQLYTFESPAP